MKVILKKDINSLGKVGDVVEVKSGYGRNFLIPQEKAIEVTSKNLKILEYEKQLLESKLRKAKKNAEKLAEKIEGLSLSILKQAGENEKLFGSVTPIDIQKALKKEGLEIDRKDILLNEPIKSLGVYPVSIKVHPGATAKIEVQVIKA
jgi:large subunit ribosomal protein L9